jgi:hypothetical protein
MMNNSTDSDLLNKEQQVRLPRVQQDSFIYFLAWFSLVKFIYVNFAVYKEQQGEGKIE